LQQLIISGPLCELDLSNQHWFNPFAAFQYLQATGLEKEPDSPLFPAAIGKTEKLSRRPLARTDAADMLKRRLKRARLPTHYSAHSFRATGITNFWKMTALLKPLNASPTTPTAGRRSSMTAAGRRFS
jgi:hypothetical protein